MKFQMYKIPLPDMNTNKLSNTNNANLSKYKPISNKINEIPSNFDSENLLTRRNESKPKDGYTLDLRCEKLDNIPILTNFKHHKVLDISSNNVKILNNLQYLSELRELKIFDNQLEIISNLENLKELVVLQAQYNKIQEIGTGALRYCKKLKHIRLDNNFLHKITNNDFSNCINLTYVDVSFNNLQSISFITCLPNIEEFYASHNKIEIIPELSRCKKLSEIHLSSNIISHIGGVRDLKSLTTLDFSHNRITSLSKLGVLNKAEYLNLSDNQISIDQIKYLKTTFINLEVLNISKNGLSDIHKLLEYLSNLSNLCELYIQDNEFPIFDETCQQYSSAMVTRHLGNLLILDNVSVKNSDIDNVINTVSVPESSNVALPELSLKQVENQLTEIIKAANEFHLENTFRYNEIIKSFSENDCQSTDCQLQRSSPLLTNRTTKKSRLLDALSFASANYAEDKT